MILKERLSSNMFLRNMMADLFGRSAYTKKPGGFEPYFQYRLGKDRQRDYYLYFPEEPFALRYKNEIFNKLYTFDGDDIAYYLDFHFAAYSEKRRFLRFLKYQVNGRLNGYLKKIHRDKLNSVELWLTEKQQDIEKKQQIQQEVETETDEQMTLLARSVMTGNIQLNNKNHIEKVIQVLKLVQTVQAPLQIAKGEQVFNKFTDTDIAAMLRLHFEALKDQKINTLQKKVMKANDQLKLDNPKVQKLTVALQEFFYK